MKIAIDACVAYKETKEGLNEEEIALQENDLKEEVIRIMNNIEKGYKDKKYILVSSIGAIHRNTNRLHAHIRHLVDWSGKTVSGWKAKIKTDVLSKLISSSFNLDVTVYTEYDAKYCEQDLWSYGLKEYDSFEKIEFRELFFNMPDEVVEQYRTIGNNRYQISCKENKRTEERKQQQLSETQEIYSYISTHIQDVENLTDLISEHFRNIKALILCYYRDKQRNTGQIKHFRVSSIKDTAINYMLTEGGLNAWALADII